MQQEVDSIDHLADKAILFWGWFAQHSDELRTLEDGSPLVDEMHFQLGRYYDGLVYEMTMPKDSPRELVVSADGIREAFPAVQVLIARAPVLDGWKFTAFRPRMPDYHRVGLTFSGRKFPQDRIWFEAQTQEGAFDLLLFHQDYDPEQRNLIINGTYILLDVALGEYDVMTGIRYIDHQEAPADPKAEGLRPFSELREVYDNYHRQ